jgi:hypothetical protein
LHRLTGVRRKLAVIEEIPDLRKQEIAVLSDSSRHLTFSTRLLEPVDARIAPLFCLLLLTTACVLASLVFACATPFAAFAAFAGAMLPLSAALPVVVATWIINQAIGFGVLDYPVDMNTLLWGVSIGMAASIATVVSAQVPRLLPAPGRVAGLALSLITAYTVYEIVLLTFTPVLGGTGAFTIRIVARLGLLNIAWMIGLLMVCEGLRIANIHRGRFVT